jgi:hypothetical protein
MYLMMLSFLQRPYMLWASESYTYLSALACYALLPGFDELVPKKKKKAIDAGPGPEIFSANKRETDIVPENLSDGVK